LKFVLLQVLLSPVVYLYSSFLQFKADALYRARHNSQICYLTAVCNDKFDPVLRRIRIKNTAFIEPVRFYEIEDNQEVNFYEIEDGQPVSFPEASELGGSGIDFTVYVPPALQPGTPAAELAIITRMRAQIDIYSLYGKNYNIIWQDIS